MLRLTLISLALAGFAFTTGASSPAESATSATEAAKTDFFPQPVKQARPIYPPELRAAEIEGEANISFVVNTEGKVVDATVISTTQPEFGVAALEAVQQWEFIPGRKGGRLVNTRLNAPVVFSLPKL